MRAEAAAAAVRQEIVAAAAPIVRAIIRSAKQGNYLPAKFLFEFAGLSAAPEGGGAEAASLAQTLLQLLQGPGEEKKGSPPGGRCNGERVE